MVRIFALLFFLVAAGLPAEPAGTLDIYFIDVEGGQATLIVSPAGESMLVDAGWPGFEGRDQDRILAAAKRAGVRQIDYLLMTHYHTDHVGGVIPLAERFPIAAYVDHGDNTETGPRPDALAAPYYRLREKARHIVVKPGDTIPLRGVNVTVVAARGELISSPLPGAGRRNPLCADAIRKDPDATENGKSVGFILEYGKFRFSNLADLTWNLELGLACPADKLGPVDLYLTNHHGVALSNPPQLVHALNPRVIVMNNGEKKGGSLEAWKVFQETPRLEAFWQLHYSAAGGQAANPSDKYIANLATDGKGYGLKVSAASDGSFSLVSDRTGLKETYAAVR